MRSNNLTIPQPNTPSSHSLHPHYSQPHRRSRRERPRRRRLELEQLRRARRLEIGGHGDEHEHDTEEVALEQSIESQGTGCVKARDVPGVNREIRLNSLGFTPLQPSLFSATLSVQPPETHSICQLGKASNLLRFAELPVDRAGRDAEQLRGE